MPLCKVTDTKTQSDLKMETWVWLGSDMGQQNNLRIKDGDTSGTNASNSQYSLVVLYRTDPKQLRNPQTKPQHLFNY